MEYVILTTNRESDLVKLVRKYLDLGFEPQGGVTVSWAPGSFQTWAQAMIKREKITT